MIKRGAWLTLICCMVAIRALAAQRGGAPVRGIVFDSLRGQPLRDAAVSIGGGLRTITTDARGRFQFDSVSPGTHTVTARHAFLDSIGLPGLSTMTVVNDGGGDVRLSTPSFSSMWRVACGVRPSPADSGIVYGTIRDADSGRPIGDATVELSWPDYRLDTKRRIVERRWHIETRTNKQGGYAICGVPPDVALELRAVGEGATTGVLELSPGSTRVQRRDLLTATGDSTARGDLRGTINDLNGNVVTDARVVADRAIETRSDSLGSFELKGVPAGTRQLQVFAIGEEPANLPVDILPHEATTLALQLRPVYMLNSMTTTSKRGVRVAAMEFDSRRKSGFGYTMDSTDMVRYDQFVNVLRSFPNLNVQFQTTRLNITVPDGKGGGCAPDVLIDGARASFNHLVDLQPNEIGGLEIYPRATHIPPKFVPTGIQPLCGMILVWTKYGFRNR